MSYIKISNVSKIYKDGDNKFYALKNINLEFERGEFIAIIGESGCGKSTLLNLILGISDISKGDIYVDNKSLKKFNKTQRKRYLNKKIGIIFQKYNLIDLYNLINNIKIIKNKNIDDNKIHNLIKQVGINNVKNKKMHEISGGEMQRVAFVRALINNPSILLLDEPTGELDQVNSEKLLELINKIKDDKLIIMVTHNIGIANKYSTRIIELKDGEVYKDVKNSSNNKVSNYNDDYINNHYLSIKYILIYIYNLIKKKKGRFSISIICCVFLLFFLSLSFMSMNLVNDYINIAFLSSLDANVIDLKSYEIKDKEIFEIDLPTIVLNELDNNNDYNVRKNYNDYLKNNLLNKLYFKNNNRNINLNGIEIYCMSSYNDAPLKYGKMPTKPNEVIINNNLYQYLNINNIINQRFDINGSDEYLKIVGVSYNAFMNGSLAIYFDHDLISQEINSNKINDYQIDIKDLNNIDKIIKELKENHSYIEKDQLESNQYNYSLEYSIDLDNYYVFYELIKMVKIVIYFFLIIASLISIILLSNVIYSFNEEEKRNLAILKVLGFSNTNIGLINIILSIILSILSFLIILIINYYINIYFTPLINEFLDLNKTINLLLGYKENIFMYIIIFLIAIISSIFPLIKLNKIQLDDVLRGE